MTESDNNYSKKYTVYLFIIVLKPAFYLQVLLVEFATIN